jgi:hypothetical protein
MIKPIAVFFPKTAKHFLILCCYILFCTELNAQSTPNNLVTNYSFEDYNCCPVDIAGAARWCQPNFWYSASAVGAYPSYVNACANNIITGVPFNAGGGGQNFQYARTGNGYMAMYYYNGMDSRNYVQIKLSDSLRNGRCYYAEYYINLLNTMRLGSNNQSMLFTNNAVYVDTIATPYGVLPANPQIQNPFIVTDTLNWVKISGVFTAQGGEQYLTLGNFKNNAQTATQQIQNTGYNGAAYYIEDVTVVPLDSITLQADAGLDKTITIGDSVFIGSFTTGLTNVTWYNSSGNIIANNVSGLFVKPTSSTFYVIEQTVCGQYSRDTVNITVNAAVPLVIKNYELKVKNEGVVNRWVTVNEINVSHFNIQYSNNSIDFSTVKTVAAKNNPYNEYTVSVIPPLGGGEAYYRIEAVDKDGTITYSKVLPFTVNPTPFTLNIYPNPANAIVNIAYPEIKQIDIIDVNGKTILHKQGTGFNNIQLNVSNLPKGIYLVRVLGKNGNSETQKLVLQ